MILVINDDDAHGIDGQKGYDKSIVPLSKPKRKSIYMRVRQEGRSERFT